MKAKSFNDNEIGVMMMALSIFQKPSHGKGKGRG